MLESIKRSIPICWCSLLWLSNYPGWWWWLNNLGERWGRFILNNISSRWKQFRRRRNNLLELRIYLILGLFVWLVERRFLSDCFWLHKRWTWWLPNLWSSWSWNLKVLFAWSRFFQCIKRGDCWLLLKQSFCFGLKIQSSLSGRLKDFLRLFNICL